MPSEIFESIVSDRISNLLHQEFQIDSRAERTGTKKRPDIICYHQGLLIGFELSYSKSDAERDAQGRINEHMVDLVIGVWLKEQYPNVTESKLDELIKQSKFDIKVFVEVESLLPFLEKTTNKKLTPEGWFTDVRISDFKDFIENAIDFLVKEERVNELTNEVRLKVDEFILSLSALDSNGERAKNYYDLLWKLYGLSLGKNYSEINEVIFGQVALSILLSSAFYEHARNNNPSFSGLSSRVKDDPINDLTKAIQDLLQIDYEVALKNTVEMLKIMPPSLGRRIKDLVDLGTKIVSKRALLKRDFVGRIYHEITGDLALRKGFATYYTEVPAAYLLASLAAQTLFEGSTSQQVARRLESLEIGDLCCGSGTLLIASYYVVDRLAARIRFYDEIDLDLKQIGKRLLEDGIHGVDALRYATQISAINLAMMSPDNLEKQSLSTVYLGYMRADPSPLAWLGSLELLRDGENVQGILAWIEGSMGAFQKVSVKAIEGGFSLPDKLDLLIMNPPFTRATGRTEKFDDERSSLFGFIVDPEARDKVKEAFEDVREGVRQNLIALALEKKNDFPQFISRILDGRDGDLKQYLAIGQAGEGALFMYLAHKYAKSEGTIAFVLPRNVLAGSSWFLIRTLLSTKYDLKYVIVSSQGNNYNFSESTLLSEALIVAKRTDKHTQKGQTVFINLLQKPQTALEAIMLADKVENSSASNSNAVYGNNGITAILTKVSRDKLLEYADNWNRFLAVSDTELSKELFQLIEESKIRLGKVIIPIDLIRFGTMIRSMGVNRRGDIIEAFDLPVVRSRVDCGRLTKKVPGSYPMLCGGGEDVKKKMQINSNAHVISAKNRKADRVLELRSRLLIPSRIWWDTTGVIALVAKERIISNMYLMTRLEVENEESAVLTEKAITVWINSVWGILLVLVNREETRGRFSGLNIGHWKLLPVLNVQALNKSTLKKLAAIFDKFADVEFDRLYLQFSSKIDEVNRNRLELDMALLRALEPKIDRDEAKEKLLEMYGRIRASFEAWMKED